MLVLVFVLVSVSVAVCLPVCQIKWGMGGGVWMTWVSALLLVSVAAASQLRLATVAITTTNHTTLCHAHCTHSTYMHTLTTGFADKSWPFCQMLLPLLPSTAACYNQKNTPNQHRIR